MHENHKQFSSSEAKGKTLVFYDGVCRVCNNFTQYLINKDNTDKLRFVSLQSEMGIKIAGDFGKDATKLDTMYAVTDFGTDKAKIHDHSTAAIIALSSLGGFWSLMKLGWLVPAPIRDLIYQAQAKSRYHMFGRNEQCMIPTQDIMHKFIDF